MLSNFLCSTASRKFMGATKLTLAGSSRLGSKPGTFEGIRAWKLMNVNLGYDKRLQEEVQD